MRLSPSQAGLLAQLARGKSLAKSRIPKAILERLQDGGVVRLERSGSSYIVRGIQGKLPAFVEHEWGIRDLNRYAESGPENRSRASLAEIAGDSKALPNHPMEGLYLRYFREFPFKGQILSPTPLGCATFVSIHELSHLEVKNRLLIGIENPACLLNFEKAVHYFPELHLDSAVLILRWCWGSRWKQWLQHWNGDFAYFPDYDPAGLKIFATEILTEASNARLLIPPQLGSHIEERGSRKLFLHQELMLSSLPRHSDIDLVKQYIMASRKALEQEALLY